jgi:hypothetical protein
MSGGRYFRDNLTGSALTGIHLGGGTGALRDDQWRSNGVSFHRMGIMVSAHHITGSLFHV